VHLDCAVQPLPDGATLHIDEGDGALTMTAA
jgi:hypothetical protein